MKQTTIKKKTKKRYVLPCDRISELPCNILQSILMLLPLRDLVRTSILSRNWRYQWVEVPQLVFKDDPKYLVSREERYRYNAKKVLEILSIHHGPILKFTLDMKAWLTCDGLDSIILFLSRNGIKELTLLMPNNNTESYELTSSMLPPRDLRHLRLSSCVIRSSSFVAFSNLVSLQLSKVGLDPIVSISLWPFLETLVLYDLLTDVDLLNIDAPNLKKLRFRGKCTRIGIINTPLLEVLWLYGQPDCYTGNCSSDFMSLLLSLPLLADLRLSYHFLEVLDVGDDASAKLPKLLTNLGMLEFDVVDLCDMDNLTPALWFIRSSPNLRKIKFDHCIPDACVPVASIVEAERYLKTQDHSNYLLLKLQEVKMTLYGDTSSDTRLVIEFSKFLLGVSPVLETLHIERDVDYIGVDSFNKLCELSCSPRASSKAKIVGLESLRMIVHEM